MEIKKDKCLILHNFPFQERDRVVQFLTENHGKITGIAKNGLHSKRFGGSLELLSCSEISWVEKRTSDMSRIDTSQIVRSFDNIKKNYSNFCIAIYALDFTKRVLQDKIPMRNFFILLSNVLFYLDTTNLNKKILHVFHQRLISLLGYKLKFSECANCGLHIMTGIGQQNHQYEKWLVNVEDGKIYCDPCARLTKKDLYLKIVSADSLRFMNVLEVTPFNELLSIPYEQNDRELYEILKLFIMFHIPGMEKETKTQKTLEKAIF